MRPGLVLGVTFQNLIDNEVAGQEGGVPVEDVLQHSPETLRLSGHPAVYAGGEEGGLLYAILHDLTDSFIVDAAHDLPDQGEALHPVVAVGVDYIVEDGVADLLGGEDMMTHSVLEDVEQMLLLLAVAEREITLV